MSLYFKGAYVIFIYLFFIRSLANSFSSQAKDEIGLSCIMMARALLVHWLLLRVVSVFSCLVLRPSIIFCVLMRSASSCVENQGGLYYCLAHEGDGNLLFGEMGHVVT